MSDTTSSTADQAVALGAEQARKLLDRDLRAVETIARVTFWSMCIALPVGALIFISGRTVTGAFTLASLCVGGCLVLNWVRGRFVEEFNRCEHDSIFRIFSPSRLNRPCRADLETLYAYLRLILSEPVVGRMQSCGLDVEKFRKDVQYSLYLFWTGAIFKPLPTFVDPEQLEHFLSFEMTGGGGLLEGQAAHSIVCMAHWSALPDAELVRSVYRMLGQYSVAISGCEGLARSVNDLPDSQWTEVAYVTFLSKVVDMPMGDDHRHQMLAIAVRNIIASDAGIRLLMDDEQIASGRATLFGHPLMRKCVLEHWGEKRFTQMLEALQLACPRSWQTEAGALFVSLSHCQSIRERLTKALAVRALGWPAEAQTA